MAQDKTLHEAVGLPDGHVDENNEKIVYEYNDRGEFAGFHKEPVNEESQNSKEAKELKARNKEE